MIRTLAAAALIAAGAPAVAAQEIAATTIEEMALSPHPDFDGISAAMIVGGFDRPGLYAANSVILDGGLFPPHAHPDDRLSVVLSGTMYLGVGDTVDRSDERAFPAGTIALTPAGTMHWMATRGGDVRILEIGAGPSGTTFAD